ncbi:MAG TPA: glycoside hydrolase family 43 protein [Longimicrobium sp.]
MHDPGSAPGGELRLPPSPGAPFAFEVALRGGEGGASPLDFTVTGPDAGGARVTEAYRLRERTHKAYMDLFAEIARRFGTRVPRNRRPAEASTFTAPFLPLLTENLSPRVLHGYGDPAVSLVRGEDGSSWYYLVATSNDAPDAFPIARSRDLRRWEMVGFVFPRGHGPAWAAEGEGTSDFWAPEMHRVGGEYRVYFSAREREGRDLAIGVAASRTPGGPFATPAEPVLRGGVIDPHVVVDDDGTAFLLWKDDSNGVWPGLLHQLLYEHGRLIAALFPEDEDRRAVSLVAALRPWVGTLGPMECFFAQQLLIEAVVDRFSATRARLDALLETETDAGVRRAVRGVIEAMRTPVWAQRLSPDGRSLEGERTLVLENDQEWEAHLIEGVWVARHGGRYYLFYAGNDFSTARYGIGVAVADAPLGPYRKHPQPLLRSTAEWWGPGHPSVARGPDGGPWLFLHAFFPGKAGYNEFRALLAVPLVLDGERVAVRAAVDGAPGGPGAESGTEMQTSGGAR